MAGSDFYHTLYHTTSSPFVAAFLPSVSEGFPRRGGPRNWILIFWLREKFSEASFFLPRFHAAETSNDFVFLCSETTTETFASEDIFVLILVVFTLSCSCLLFSQSEKQDSEMMAVRTAEKLLKVLGCRYLFLGLHLAFAAFEIFPSAKSVSHAFA